jgi:hypothetical protein
VNPVYIIPTYVGGRRKSQNYNVVANYDHVTPLSHQGELPRCLASLREIGVTAPIILLVAAEEGSEQEAFTKIDGIASVFGDTLDITVIGSEFLRELYIRADALGFAALREGVSLTGYGAIRNLGLLIAAIAGYTEVIFLDDDEVIRHDDFQERALYGLGKLTRNGIPVLVKTGFFTDSEGNWLSREREGWYDCFWAKGKLFNEWIEDAMDGPRLSRSNNLYGGLVAIHREAYRRVCFDPWISRGEDLDYLLNLRMYGGGVWFDNQWSILHLPPAERNEAQRFRQDIYRWIYEQRKIGFSRVQPDLIRIQPNSLEPYPGPFLERSVSKRVFITALLRSIGKPDHRGYLQAALAARREARSYAEVFCSKYFEFQQIWPQVLAEMEGDAVLAEILSGVTAPDMLIAPGEPVKATEPAEAAVPIEAAQTPRAMRAPAIPITPEAQPTVATRQSQPARELRLMPEAQPQSQSEVQPQPQPQSQPQQREKPPEVLLLDSLVAQQSTSLRSQSQVEPQTPARTQTQAQTQTQVQSEVQPQSQTPPQTRPQPEQRSEMATPAASPDAPPISAAGHTAPLSVVELTHELPALGSQPTTDLSELERATRPPLSVIDISHLSAQDAELQAAQRQAQRETEAQEREAAKRAAQARLKAQEAARQRAEALAREQARAQAAQRALEAKQAKEAAAKAAAEARERALREAELQAEADARAIIERVTAEARIRAELEASEARRRAEREAAEARLRAERESLLRAAEAARLQEEKEAEARKAVIPPPVNAPRIPASAPKHRRIEETGDLRARRIRKVGPPIQAPANPAQQQIEFNDQANQ